MPVSLAVIFLFPVLKSILFVFRVANSSDVSIAVIFDVILPVATPVIEQSCSFCTSIQSQSTHSTAKFIAGPP